ncbi:unnamed protein product [Blepharisma stoltei]|uniref:Uncharacterized protein n=1 Tax=Blepharisma stoltei TaxID=1481888 RepID=A0AAU9K093_9CILI|nr:unnamed protein product [Blepharisma stoltei]
MELNINLMDRPSKLEETYLYDFQKVSNWNLSIKNARGFQYTWTQPLSALQKPDPLPEALKTASLIENSLLDLSISKINKKHDAAEMVTENTPMPHKKHIMNISLNPNFRRKYHSGTIISIPNNSPGKHRNPHSTPAGIWEHYEDLNKKLDAISRNKVSLKDILSNQRNEAFQDEVYIKKLFSTENIFSENTLLQLKNLEEKVKQMKKDLKQNKITNNIRSRSSGHLFPPKRNINRSSLELPKISVTPQARQFRDAPNRSATKLLKKFVVNKNNKN